MSARTSSQRAVRAPTSASELFGDYAAGPSRALQASVRDLRPLVSGVDVDGFCSGAAVMVSHGPHDRWDADEMGKRTVAFVFDGVRAADAALVDLALRERDRGEGIDVSNLGGYHSRPDAFERLGGCAAALRATVERACEACWDAVRGDAKSVWVKAMMGAGDPTKVTTSWANVCERTNGHGLHNHVNAVWSGVYYASDGRDAETTPREDVDEPGDLLIRVTAGGLDPLSEGPSGYCSYMCVKPKVGRLVVFPSWVLHGVLASAGDSPRVSYAFNTGEIGVKF